MHEITRIQIRDKIWDRAKAIGAIAVLVSVEDKMVNVRVCFPVHSYGSDMVKDIFNYAMTIVPEGYSVTVYPEDNFKPSQPEAPALKSDLESMTDNDKGLLSESWAIAEKLGAKSIRIETDPVKKICTFHVTGLEQTKMGYLYDSVSPRFHNQWILIITEDNGISKTKVSVEQMKWSDKNDPVSHPSHYNSGKIEVIEAIEDWKLGFHLGNAIKYIARAGKKNPDKIVEDLEKSIWYVRRQIETMKESPRRPNEMPQERA